MKYMKAITVEDYELAKRYFEIVEYNQVRLIRALYV